MGIFTEQDQELIANAISEAEKATSGEIRIAVEKHCKSDPFERATTYFSKLDMDKTAKHNGVLIYLAYDDHKFAIIGDSGINKLVPPDFWETTQTAMKAHFAGGNIVQGIIAGVVLAGEKLALYFPFEGGDINELPNEIVFMDQHKSS